MIPLNLPPMGDCGSDEQRHKDKGNETYLVERDSHRLAPFVFSNGYFPRISEPKKRPFDWALAKAAKTLFGTPLYR